MIKFDQHKLLLFSRIFWSTSISNFDDLLAFVKGSFRYPTVSIHFRLISNSKSSRKIYAIILSHSTKLCRFHRKSFYSFCPI